MYLKGQPCNRWVHCSLFLACSNAMSDCFQQTHKRSIHPVTSEGRDNRCCTGNNVFLLLFFIFIPVPHTRPGKPIPEDCLLSPQFPFLFCQYKCTMILGDRPPVLGTDSIHLKISWTQIWFSALFICFPKRFVFPFTQWPHIL